jgi:hypothetical protein
MGPISISGDVRGPGALEYLVDPVLDVLDEELLIAAGGVTHADAYLGAALQAHARHHVGLSDDHTATLWLPSAQSPRDRVHDLFGQAPVRCFVPKAGTGPALRDRLVFLPAQNVSEVDEAQLVAVLVKLLAPGAGLSSKASGYLAHAVPPMTENSLTHAADSTCGAIICGAVEPDSGDAQLVTTDLGSAISQSSDPVSTLREAIGRSTQDFGELSAIGQLAEQSGLDVTIRIASGTAHARWRSAHGWESGSGVFRPGFTVGIIVHGQRITRAVTTRPSGR